jgi:hypothetical protein
MGSVTGVLHPPCLFDALLASYTKASGVIWNEIWWSAALGRAIECAYFCRTKRRGITLDVVVDAWKGGVCDGRYGGFRIYPCLHIDL